MEHHPPIAIIVTVPGCIFNLADFSNAYPSVVDAADTKIEWIKGGSIIIRDFSLDDLGRALQQAGAPDQLVIPE